MKHVRLTLAVLLAAVVLSSCNKKALDALRTENATLKQLNEDIRVELAECNASSKSLSERIAAEQKRLEELRADYHDYLNTHHLALWPKDNERQQRLRLFCHSHNDYDDYEPLLAKMNDEEMANMALTLCHQTDKMMWAYIEKLEEKFVKEGGIKERMHKARTGYRAEQDARLKALEEENKELKNRIKELESLLKTP